MMITNLQIAKRSDGKYRTVLLLEHDDETEPVLDVTITSDPSSIAGISERLQEVCEENGLGMRESMRAALAVEEMAVYAVNKHDQDSYMDILARIHKGNVEIDFRSLGPIFDPFEEAGDDGAENVAMLRGIAGDMQTDYILGMNSIRITIKPSEGQDL